MNFRSALALITATVLLTPISSTQAQPYELYNDPDTAQMCEMPPQQAQQQPNVNADSQRGLYSIGGEGVAMTKEQYERWKMRQRVDGVGVFNSPGGAAGYLIGRLFSDDPDRQLNAARLGKAGFNLLQRSQSSSRHTSTPSSRRVPHNQCIEPLR